MMWYVASSWKNAIQVKELIEALRKEGYEVYDFTHHSFNWADLQVPDEKEKALIDGRDKLPDAAWFEHPLVNEHFHKDMDALQTCDALVAIFPAGNSTHIEIGYVAGRGKPIYAITPPNGLKRDLLYLLFNNSFTSIVDFICYLRGR